MNIYTRETFVYKEINKLLRNESKKTKEQFAKEFITLFPYYFMITKA